MKTNVNIVKLTLGFFLLASVSTFANNNDPIKEKVEKSNAELLILESPSDLNDEYVEVVHESASQEAVEFLSGIVAEWDASESPKFDARNKPFSAVFKSNKGFAEVTYNNEGLVIAAEKRLKNVVLPNQLTLLVAKRYEGWVIVQNKYFLSYKQGSDVEKMYQLTLKKGNEKKIIRMDV